MTVRSEDGSFDWLVLLPLLSLFLQNNEFECLEMEQSMTVKEIVCFFFVARLLFHSSLSFLSFMSLYFPPNQVIESFIRFDTHSLFLSLLKGLSHVSLSCRALSLFLWIFLFRACLLIQRLNLSLCSSYFFSSCSRSNLNGETENQQQSDTEIVRQTVWRDREGQSNFRCNSFLVSFSPPLHESFCLCLC